MILEALLLYTKGTGSGGDVDPSKMKPDEDMEQEGKST